MKSLTRCLATALLAAASIWWLGGCSGSTTTTGTKTGATTKETGHKESGHKEAGHKDGDHKKEGHKDGHKEGHKDGGHHDKPLTAKDVKMPATFKAGVSRQEELHKQIHHHVEHGELAKVHRVAEEMALVANKMKELAQKEVAEDRRVEAGRLCNELAGYYKPIDEAADAGKKAETVALHKKMGETIHKLKELAK